MLLNSGSQWLYHLSLICLNWMDRSSRYCWSSCSVPGVAGWLGVAGCGFPTISTCGATESFRAGLNYVNHSGGEEQTGQGTCVAVVVVAVVTSGVCVRLRGCCTAADPDVAASDEAAAAPSKHKQTVQVQLQFRFSWSRWSEAEQACEAGPTCCSCCERAHQGGSGSGQGARPGVGLGLEAGAIWPRVLAPIVAVCYCCPLLVHS